MLLMRTQPVFQQTDAEDILGPYRSVLFDAISGSWSDYATVLRERPSETAGMSSFTRTRFIHDRTVHRLAVVEAAGEHPGLRLKKIRQLWVVILDDVLMLKLKKLNAKLRSRNIATGQTKAFDKQDQLLPANAGVLTNATSGYVTDALGSEIVRAVVVCWEGPEKRWEVDLSSSAAEGGVIVTVPAGPVPTDQRSRTRVIVEQPETDIRAE
jgi:hypothetical protein